MAGETLTLEEAAERSALSPDEIKESEEVGLLPKGKTEFTREDVQALSGISCLKRLGNIQYPTSREPKARAQRSTASTKPPIFWQEIVYPP